jgi:hypothetical protein
MTSTWPLTRPAARRAESRRLVLLAVLLLWSGGSFAQSEPASSTELSKESVNPVTRQITLPLRYEAEFQDGPYKATKSTFELDQAVVPFRLNEDWALITRTKFPAVVEPPKKFGDHWTSGLGNGYTTFFLSPEHGEGFYWGAGPVLYYPSATNSALGVHRWGSGPSAAFVVKDEGPWVFGAVVNNIWSLGSDTILANRTNSFLLNPSVSYHFDDGWSVSSSPNITANWIAKGAKWTVPIGGGFSKAGWLGEQPAKLGLDAYYDAVRPKPDNDTWLVQLTLTFLFPN